MRGRVLLVDDSPTVRTLLRAQLPDSDYVVVEADGGADGMRLALEVQPDVVLLDIEMPEPDGFAVLRDFRDDEHLRDIPVILLTGRIDPDDVAQGLRGGAHDYLRKPTDATELLARVDAAIRTKRLQDELRMRNEELEQAACTDSLTGLYNRRFTDEELVRLCSRSKRHVRDLGIALLDVDRFKALNDRLGHEAGDRVLVEISRRLAARKRAEDVIGRWGGGEFIVLMPDTTVDGAALAGEAFRSSIADKPFRAGGTDIEMTISVGVSSFQPDDRPEDLVRRADEGLLEAKRAGRDQVRG